MFFLERLLHISPDNGNGLTEMAILAVVIAGWLLSHAVGRLAKRRPAG